VSDLRTLPIRVDPEPGEAFDSWLEALASRLDTPLVDAVAGLALQRRRPGRKLTHDVPPDWTIALHDDEIAALVASAGGSAERYRRMTLAHYDGTAVDLDLHRRVVIGQSMWGRGRGSRYCPDCLSETEGTWLLAWRLGWSFACTRHQRLLVDTCPDCGAVPRLHPHVLTTVPRPGFCARPDQAAATPSGLGASRCGADLTTADSLRLCPQHPALLAAAVIDDALDGRVPPRYADAGLGVRHLLTDARALAQLVLQHATTRALHDLLPTELVLAHLKARARHPQAPDRPGFMAPPAAAITAAALTVGLGALTRPGPRQTAEHLEGVVRRARDAGRVVNPSTVQVLGSVDASPVLSTSLLAALDGHLRPNDRLRCRSFSSQPGYPNATEDPGPARLRRLPQQLWPAWSTPLTPPEVGLHPATLRAALSAAIALVGSRVSFASACRELGEGMERRGLARALQHLGRSPSWPGVAHALDRLATHLDVHEGPIDYERRRALSYDDLLDVDAWTAICDDIGITPARIRHVNARLFTYVLLTGNDPAHAPTPYGAVAATDRASWAQFPAELTPALLAHLQAAAAGFLRRRGIDEPVGWHPPPEQLLDGLDLPGPRDDQGIDLHQLHHLVRRSTPLGAVAVELGTTLDHVRDLLARHPAPHPGTGPSRFPGSTDRRRRRLRTGHTPEMLRRLYLDEGKSLRTIATEQGVPRRLLSELIREGGHVPPTGRPVTFSISYDWLHEQYVRRGRTLPDIAAELGSSPANIARHAHQLGVPLRARGGGSHAVAQRATRAARRGPSILQGLTGAGAAQRLHRLAQASQHLTLTAAARAIGCGQSALVTQLNRLEDEVGGALFARAERGRPMSVRADGLRRVVLLVATCCVRSWWTAPSLGEPPARDRSQQLFEGAKVVGPHELQQGSQTGVGEGVALHAAQQGAGDPGELGSLGLGQETALSAAPQLPTNMQSLLLIACWGG